jgi:hypothetical protein
MIVIAVGESLALIFAQHQQRLGGRSIFFRSLRCVRGWRWVVSPMIVVAVGESLALIFAQHQQGREKYCHQAFVVFSGWK